MKLNEKLQALRKEKGMSQEDLGDILGVSRQAISKWESGQSYPEMEKLIALSALFGVTMDNLVKDDTDLREDAPPHEDYGDGFPFIRYPTSRHYEYKSKRTLRGLPLVHINLGGKPKGGLRRAKGIVAIGDVATGVVSMGLFSAGVVSFGAASTGIISMGAVSVGLGLAAGAVAAGGFAVGGISIGVVSMGGIAMGAFSVGGVAHASHVAIGNHASGHIAIGEVVNGAKTIVDTSPDHNFAFIKAGEVRELIQGEYPNLWKSLENFLVGFFRR